MDSGDGTASAESRGTAERARNVAARTDLHPAHRPSAAVDYSYPSEVWVRLLADFSPHRTAGAESSRSRGEYPFGRVGQISRPHEIWRRTDRFFLPLEVWVKLPATGNSEDGADTVLHNSAEIAWLSILTTFAQG